MNAPGAEPARPEAPAEDDGAPTLLELAQHYAKAMRQVARKTVTRLYGGASVPGATRLLSG